MKRFSDFAEERKALDGRKIKIDDIINREIIVTGYRISKSKFNDDPDRQQYMILQMEIDGERRVAFTGSMVLIDLIRKYGEQIPFATTIKKIDRYYTFT